MEYILGVYDYFISVIRCASRRVDSLVGCFRLRTCVAFVIPLAIAVFVFLSWGPGGKWMVTWHNKWSMLLLVCSVALSYVFYRKYGLAVSLVFLSVMISGFSVISYPYRHQVFRGMEIMDTIAIQRTAARSMLSFLIPFMFFLFYRHRRAVTFSIQTVYWLTVASAFWFWSVASVGGGILGNPSMTGCLIAITMSFMPWWAWIPGIMAITAIKATMPWAVLVAMIFARSKYILVLILPAALLIPNILDSNGRFIVWQKGLEWWWNNAPHWFGMGTGTCIQFLSYVQKVTGANNGWNYMWFHNDWLQVLFEQGVFGLMAFSVLFITCVYNSRKNKKIFGAVLAFGVCAVGNYPARLPVHAYVGFCLAYLAMTEERWRLEKSVLGVVGKFIRRIAQVFACSAERRNAKRVEKYSMHTR